MIYLTPFPLDGDNIPTGPSQPIEAETLEVAATLVGLAALEPCLKRARFWTYDMGGGAAVCLSFARFS